MGEAVWNNVQWRMVVFVFCLSDMAIMEERRFPIPGELLFLGIVCLFGVCVCVSVCVSFVDPYENHIDQCQSAGLTFCVWWQNFNANWFTKFCSCLPCLFCFIF